MGKPDSVLENDYKNLGTIPLDDLKQALWEDIEALNDEFGVSFDRHCVSAVPLRR